jgi:glycoside/pentoside/hexuronide:cation symporter, GPH family
VGVRFDDPALGLGYRLMEERLSNRQLLLFSLPAIPVVALHLPVYFFLPAFFTGELGISMTAWAFVILVARVWDMVSDPIAGVICDRIPSRWGRRRHWVAAGVPILMVSCAMLFMPQYFIGGMTLAYALAVMCLLQVGQTLLGLNQQAWGAELSDDYQERSRIMGWRAAVGGVAPLIAFGIPMVVERTSANPEMANGDKLFYIGIFVLISLPTLTAIALACIGERPSLVKPVENRMDLFQSWRLLLKNKIMVRLIVIEVFAALPFSIAMAVNFFYVAYVLEAPHLMSSLLLLVFASSLISMPMWMRVSQKFEKHKLLTATYIISAVLASLQVFLGAGDVVPFAIITCTMAVFTSGPSFLLRSIVADVVDSDTLATGEQRTGTFYALVEMTQKFVPAIAVPLVFPFLEWQGFVPELGLENTSASIAAIKYSFVLFPPIPMVIAAYLLYTFPLGRKEQEAVRREIESIHGTRE